MTHLRKNTQHREPWNSVQEHYKETITGLAICVSTLRGSKEAETYSRLDAVIQRGGIL